MKSSYLIIVVITAVVIFALVYGFGSIASPFVVRGLKFDQQRLSDFSNLRYSIESYSRSVHKLPKALTDLNSNSFGYYSANAYKDPETQKEYDYAVATETSYKLCTVFSLDSAEAKKFSESNNSPYYYYYQSGNIPDHKKGYDCITYNLPPEIIPTASSSLNYPLRTIVPQ